MIQEAPSSHNAPPAPIDELEFEPTLSADMAGTPENHGDSEDEGDQVRDEELMLDDAHFVSPDPFPPPRQSQPAPSSVPPSHFQHTINGGFEVPRAVVPPPLSRRPSDFRSVSAEQSRIPTFGDDSLEPPIFGGRPAEPLTSVHRTLNSSGASDSFARNVEERPIHSQPRSRIDGDEPRLFAATTSRLALESAEYARPSGSDRPTLERRRPQRKDIIREGDILLGKLRIERVVTEGLLVTAEAVHLNLGTRAQVVLLSPHGRGFADAQEHFARTARTVAQMQSEHVARVIEMGTLESGAPFLVTELAGYSDLAELLRVRGPLSVSDAVDYAVQIAEAFAEAHSLGVIHGSLRPSSLRVSEGIDGWPLVKVLGFGAMAQWSLSSASVRPSSHRGAVVNSALPYLSPEQIRSPGEVDTRTDIWSLGAILHEMLVGWPLYHADNTAALLAMIAADPPSPISAMRADVPRQLESIILRCLQKDRATRFATIADLARALQPYAPPDCQATVERIVRVMARGSSVPSVYSRPHSAMVHVRSHSAGPRTFESKAPPQQTPTTIRWGIMVSAVVLLGAAAGVTGAVFAAQMLRSPSTSEGLPHIDKQAVNELPNTPSLASIEIKNVGSSNSVSPVADVATAAAANPAISSVPNPGVAPAARSVPVAQAVPRRSPAFISTTSAARKEAKADKAEVSSTSRTADLFGDIK